MNSIFSKEIRERASKNDFNLTEGEAAIIQHISRVSNPRTFTENLIKFFNITEVQACKFLNAIDEMKVKQIKKDLWSNINKLSIEMYAFVTAHLHGNEYIHVKFFSNKLFEQMFGLKFENVWGTPLLY